MIALARAPRAEQRADATQQGVHEGPEALSVAGPAERRPGTGEGEQREHDPADELPDDERRHLRRVAHDQAIGDDAIDPIRAIAERHPQRRDRRTARPRVRLVEGSVRIRMDGGCPPP